MFSKYSTSLPVNTPEAPSMRYLKFKMISYKITQLKLVRVTNIDRDIHIRRVSHNYLFYFMSTPCYFLLDYVHIFILIG